MKKISLALMIAAAAAAAAPATALAGGTVTGYVCEVQQNSPDTVRGNAGHLHVVIRPNADCTGLPSDGYICTQGATSSDCDLAGLHNGQSLATVAQLFTTAMSQGLRVKATWLGTIAVAWRWVVLLGY